MFIDLDCRFDVLCLSEMLKHRIKDLNGKTLSSFGIISRFNSLSSKSGSFLEWLTQQVRF